MADFLSTLFGGGAEREAADKNRALYQQYGTDSTGFLDKGLNGSLGALGEARDAYAPLSDLARKYTGGTDMLLNALGINGASGSTAAKSAFTTSPGYDAGINAGLDVLNRRRAAAGMLDSGNADQDAQIFGQNSQNKEWNGWLDRLGGINNNALSATSGAASGIAGVDTNVAGVYGTDATNRVGVAGNVTSGNSNANVLQAQGEAAGARNLLGAGLSVASLAAGGGLGGGLGSSLSSLGTNMMNNGGRFNPIAGMTGR